jgi:DNA-binding GntR family transcriptional regulator
VSKQERVYSVIRERILDGQYGPGYRLVIDRIAEELAVSALPVREAVRRLEAEGLVVFRANAGAQVTPADPTLYEENMTVLALLEGYATARAVELAGDSLVEQLEAETDLMSQCIEHLDVLGFSRANQRFHAVFYAACDNPPLVDLLESTGRRLDAIRRTVFTHIPYRGTSSIADHREMIKLIRSHAPSPEIEAAARAHKLATVEAFRKWLDQTHHEENEGATPPRNGRGSDGRSPAAGKTSTAKPKTSTAKPKASSASASKSASAKRTPRSK